MPLIVNADDFGYSDEINGAIAECFARGYCASTSIMANMPGFEAACAIAHRDGLLDRVGVHLVLTEGEPLTQPIRQCPRFCDSSGRFCLTRKQRVWRLSKSEKAAVAEELQAQVTRCRTFGLPLAHADTHQHVHEEWGILPVVIDVCQREGIRQIRIARNCGTSSGPARTLYRRLVNHAIQRSGLMRTDLFGSWQDFRVVARTSPGMLIDHSIEIMIHPRYSAQRDILDETPPHPPVCLQVVAAQIGILPAQDMRRPAHLR